MSKEKIKHINIFTVNRVGLQKYAAELRMKLDVLQSREKSAITLLSEKQLIISDLTTQLQASEEKVKGLEDELTETKHLLDEANGYTD